MIPGLQTAEYLQLPKFCSELADPVSPSFMPAVVILDFVLLTDPANQTAKELFEHAQRNLTDKPDPRTGGPVALLDLLSARLNTADVVSRLPSCRKVVLDPALPLDAPNSTAVLEFQQELSDAVAAVQVVAGAKYFGAEEPDMTSRVLHLVSVLQKLNNENLKNLLPYRYESSTCSGYNYMESIYNHVKLFAQFIEEFRTSG